MKTPEEMAKERNDEKIKAAKKYAKQYEGLMYTIGSIAGVSGIQMAFERGVAFGLHQALEITVERESAERAAEQHWISVEDRLPEEGQDCLFYVDWIDVWEKGSERITYQEIGVFNGKDRFYHRAHTDLKDVTHWMPLPKPPEDNK